MSFGRRGTNTFTIACGTSNVSIASVPKQRDLGIWLSCDLSFSYHTEVTSKKAWAVLNMIKRTFSRISPRDFIFLYTTYIRPLLEYCSQIAHSGLIKDANALERVQRKATKMVVGLKDTPYDSRLSSLNLYPLESRRLRGDLIFTYQLFKLGLHTQLFSFPNTTNLRGHERKLFKRRPRTFIRQHFYTCRVVGHWNKLPPSIALAPNLSDFKKALDIFLGLAPTV
jgi:ribonuclease P/MRP protein subunit RPP40